MRSASLLFLLAMPLSAQWQLQDSHTTASLRGIYSVNGKVAWASGTNGTVLKTEDAGDGWQACTIPPGADKLDFRGIQAFDANTAIVMSSGTGDLSRLYKTEDGCKTWKLLFTNPEKEGFFDALQADSPTHALILGDAVGNKVQLWEWQDWDEPPIHHRSSPKIAESGESSFAASNSVLQIVSTPQIDPKWKYSLRWVSGTSSSSSMTVVRTEQSATCDMCPVVSTKISFAKMEKSTSSGIFSFAFRDDLTGVFVGGDYGKPELKGTAAFTEDGGLFWQQPLEPPGGYRSSVAYDAAHNTWITVGPKGTDLSTDDGWTWHPLKPSPTESPDADKNWNALSLPFVVGPHGRIGMLRPDALKTPSLSSSSALRRD